VLDGGVVKLTGAGKDLLEDPEVGRLYLGLKTVSHGA
jgi:ABC-type branched-subunit amino acid transport system ATPase component